MSLHAKILKSLTTNTLLQQMEAADLKPCLLSSLWYQGRGNNRLSYLCLTSVKVDHNDNSTCIPRKNNNQQ